MNIRRIIGGRAIFYTIVVLAGLFILRACTSGPPLQAWHTAFLDQEFTADMAQREVTTFDQYMELERKLFEQLDQEIYAEPQAGAAHSVERFNRGSLSDPGIREPNWNRTFELVPENAVGGILLLHGMSDSPYSLRAIGQTLYENGYHVIGLRLPGHGTTPSGLRHTTWRDMAAAVRIAMAHLETRVKSGSLHMIGYSTGAPLALNHTLDAIESGEYRTPASIVLISPAIRVHPTSALARFKDALSVIPGMERMAYLGIMDEFDPYKYNSFATNAGAQVHDITVSLDKRIDALTGNRDFVDAVPPILVFKSTVDATVTTAAVVDNLLVRRDMVRDELVLFDINRNATVRSTLLVSDPGPLTTRLMEDANLPFSVTFITNLDQEQDRVVARHKKAFTMDDTSIDLLNLEWPNNVVSLSHVALPFPPNDPLYGDDDPGDPASVFLGNLSFRGERGLIRISTEWLLRMRHNPFYDYMETRLVGWIQNNN